MKPNIRSFIRWKDSSAAELVCVYTRGSREPLTATLSTGIDRHHVCMSILVKLYGSNRAHDTFRWLFRRVLMSIEMLER